MEKQSRGLFLAMVEDICKASVEVPFLALQISRGKSLYPGNKELRLNARFLYFCYNGFAVGGSDKMFAAKKYYGGMLTHIATTF